MKKRLEMICEVKKRYGILPIIVEIFRVIMKTVTLITNFILAAGGMVSLRDGHFWSCGTLLGGTALIYLLALKDHSEDKIYEWSTKNYHSENHLLLTTVVLYIVIIIFQILLINLSYLLKNI
ncbi:MAG: hypothetical protein IJX92_03965 [Clostridia bacterium]|nr:hypothetical protein [Clostridia bacterium]